MPEITVDQFHEQMRAQGVPRKHIAFICPICGTVQSMASLIIAGAGSTEDEVEKYVGFSCVGRWTNAGPHRKGAAAGKGCDWTLGGLLQLHKLIVITPDGEKHPHFVPASPDQARELMATNTKPQEVRS
jgi:hypothetical protein